MSDYRFRCLGPFEFKTFRTAEGVRSFDPKAARDEVFEAAQAPAAKIGISNIQTAIGLYVFGLSPSGSDVTWPYYVGRAAKQSLYTRLFQKTDKPQKYSHILAEYERAKPFIYLFPLITAAGNQVAKTREGARAFKVIADAEYMMIGHAMNVNPFLHNIQDKIARERFSIDGTPQSERRETNAAKSFRRMMQFDDLETRSKDVAEKSQHAFNTAPTAGAEEGQI